MGLALIAFRGRDMRYALPLGTFLGAAGIVVVFVGDGILQWYRALFGGEPGRGSLRLGAVLALAVVALFELLALAHGVRSQRRLQARAALDAARRIEAARPGADPALARGREGWDAAAEAAIAMGLASEVEAVDAEGRVVFSRPHLAPVEHRLSEAERRELDGGRSVTVLARNTAPRSEPSPTCRSARRRTWRSCGSRRGRATSRTTRGNGTR